MLYISDTAKNQITRILQKEDKNDTHFVRVSVVSGGCSGFSYQMEFDDESREHDHVFEDNGMRIVTDAKSVLYLFGTTLEFSSGLDGQGFHFNNPNATRTCACGESFSV